jgi:Tol biopolymer transport system component
MTIFGHPGKLVLVGSGNQETIHRLDLDPVNGGILRGPLRVVRASIHASSPQLSPDGRRIAFAEVLAGTDHGDIRVEGMDGSGRVSLTDDPFKNEVPRWSPDGEWIAFVSDRGGRKAIWRIRPDGRSLSRLAAVPGADVTAPIWSPDGKRIAFGTEGGDAYLSELAPEGAARDPRSLPRPEEGASFEPSSWSPDGRTLAGTAGGIRLYDLGGRRCARLTEAGVAPVWLPGGRRLLFVEENALVMIDVQSGGRRGIYSPSRTSFIPPSGCRPTAGRPSPPSPPRTRSSGC